MKLKDLDLSGLKFKLIFDKNDILPEDLFFTEEDLTNFNNRIVNPKNINKIINLCKYIKLEEINRFILNCSTPTEDFYILLSENEDIKLLRFMYSRSFLYDKGFKRSIKPRFYNLCNEAIEHNLIKWLKWGITNKLGWYNGEYNNHFCNIAAINNSFECLKYLHEVLDDKILWDYKTMGNAAKYGNIKILKYLHQNKCQWNYKTIKEAGDNGQLECLKYCHENGCEWNENVSESCVKYGNLECLKYMDINNCPVIYNIGEIAVKYNQLDCLKYIISRNLFVDKDLAAKILYENSKKDFINKYYQPMINQMCITAIVNGNFECFKFLYENCNVYLENINSDLLKDYRNIDLLKYLHNRNLIKDDNLSYSLSSSHSKDFEFIIYYVDNKLPGYERFLSENFIQKINQRIRWNFNEFDIFLKSTYFKNKINVRT